MGVFLQSMDRVVEEITRINRSLPIRPPLDDIDAAMALIQNVDEEEQSRIEAISKQKKGTNISEELFFVLQEMQKNLDYFQSKEQKREALKLLELENIHMMFDEFVQSIEMSLFFQQLQYGWPFEWVGLGSSNELFCQYCFYFFC